MTKKNTKPLLVQSPLIGGDELGHWQYPRKFRISDYLGFVYCIHRIKDGKFYIGKKNLTVRGKKRSKDYGKEHKWRDYTGSSIHLNADIEELGKQEFGFEIIDLYRTRGGLYHAEAYLQMVSEALLLTMPNNNKERASYNGQIAAIRFIPGEQLTHRTRTYPTKIRRRLKELCEQ